MQELITEAIQLLKQLISTPSFSREEAVTADLLAAFFHQKNMPTERMGNNVVARAKHWHSDRPTLLLCSHHDTVRPVAGWQRDPFQPTVEDGKLYGLGSNDAGASLVSLAAVFAHFYEEKNLRWNLIFLGAAEEEISGNQGVAMVLPQLGPIDCGIVGEPTGMQMAVAQKGLLVVDATAHGKAGHAARTEGENAIYTAFQDIEFLRSFQFEKTSDLLGPVKMTVTQIEAGTQHNVVPDACRFVVDIRTNECYSNEEVFAILQTKLRSELKARSFRLNSSSIPLDHPLVQQGKALGLRSFGSPTLSDSALMPFPVLKIGPGESERSHTADEFVYLREIEEGIDVYERLIKGS
ncbi:MAG: M20/M25/M40 family metallo-hydrolase [Bacteroidetes bacterium]|nr:M20/M25/M40 family metallo-hydrolase [Bacteroidota bacterium]